jgi:three-Cys-motif partner protein
MNRNAIWRNPDRVPQEGVERMTRFWGDESWKQIAYAESAQKNLFFAPDVIKQGNEAIVAAFQERLKKVAGFTFVPEPLAMRNRTNAVVYYLLFASQKPVAKKIIEDIFKRYKM